MHYIPQEDGASSHAAIPIGSHFKQSKAAALGGMTPKGVCMPPNSPDLRPNDYFPDGGIERAYATIPLRPKNIRELRPVLSRPVENIPKGTATKACASSRARLQKCIEAGGGVFEYQF